MGDDEIVDLTLNGVSDFIESFAGRSLEFSPLESARSVGGGAMSITGQEFGVNQQPGTLRRTHGFGNLICAGSNTVRFTD
jgi:hypothetical protein